MADMHAHERRPSKAEFAREMEVAIRAAGYAGELAHAGRPGTIWVGGAKLNLDRLYGDLAGLDAARRTASLARTARVMLEPPQLPRSWAEASRALLPSLKSKMEFATDDLERLAGRGPAPIHVIDLTSHLLCVLAYPTSGGFLSVPAESLARWGVSAREAFRAAAENIERRTRADWLPGRDAPGVFVSRWADGLAGSRLFVTEVFRDVPFRGRPVVLIPTPSLLLAAGSEDETGLFHLGLLARRILEAQRTYFSLRPLRLSVDEATWEEWLPPRGHGAYDVLHVLGAIEEVHEYDEHARALTDLARSEGREPVGLPALELFQSSLGAEVLTTTTWKEEGGRTALPRADAVVFQRGGEVLGISDWRRMREIMGREIRPLAGYPTRYLAPRFPDAWQLECMKLEHWSGT